jgi:hypothetical protein
MRGELQHAVFQKMHGAGLAAKVIHSGVEDGGG